MKADIWGFGHPGPINKVSSSDLQDNYSKIHDLSTSTGEPVFIIDQGRVDGVYFSKEAFERYRERVLMMFEDEITACMYLDDYRSMREGGGQDAKEMVQDVRRELDL